MTAWLLIRASFLRTFSPGGHAAFRRMVMRLGTVTGCTFGLSWIFGKAVASLPLATNPKPWVVAFWLWMAALICVGISYASSTGLYAQRTDTFKHLLQIWPIRPEVSWLAYNLPRLYIGLLSLVLISLSVWNVGIGLGLPAVILVVLLIGAYIAATAVLAAALRLLKQRFRHSAYVTRTISQSKLEISWFLKVWWRFRSTRISLLTGILISTMVTCFAMWRGFSDITALSLIGALLSASACSDIRGIARKQSPIEIAGLKGTLWFMYHYGLCAILCSLCVALPLLIPAISHASQETLSSQDISLAATQLLAGCMAGVLSGTLFVPRSRDISGQFSAVLLCTAILFLPAYIPYIKSLFSEQPALLATASALTCVAVAYLIEYKRNPYDWRSHA